MAIQQCFPNETVRHLLLLQKLTYVVYRRMLVDFALYSIYFEYRYLCGQRWLCMLCLHLEVSQNPIPFLFRLSIRKLRNICARGVVVFLQTIFDFLTSHF